MPSPAISVRLDQFIYDALGKECLRTGKTKSELVVEYIQAGLRTAEGAKEPVRPPVDQGGIQLAQDRLKALESQMDLVLSLISGQPGNYSPPVVSSVSEVSEPILSPEEPENPDNPLAAATPEFDRYCLPLIKPYPGQFKGHYFIMAEAVPATGTSNSKLEKILRTQAKQLGFTSRQGSFNSVDTRIWHHTDFFHA